MIPPAHKAMIAALANPKAQVFSTTSLTTTLIHPAMILTMVEGDLKAPKEANMDERAAWIRKRRGGGE